MASPTQEGVSGCPGGPSVPDALCNTRGPARRRGPRSSRTLWGVGWQSPVLRVPPASVAVAASCPVPFPGLTLPLGRAGPSLGVGSDVVLGSVAYVTPAHPRLAFMVLSPWVSRSSVVFVFPARTRCRLLRARKKKKKKNCFLQCRFPVPRVGFGRNHAAQPAPHRGLRARPLLPRLPRASESDPTSPLPDGRSRPPLWGPFCRDPYQSRH